MDLTSIDTGWFAAITFAIAWGAKEFISQLKKRGIDLPLISKNSEKTIENLEIISAELDDIIVKINDVFKDDDKLFMGLDQIKETLIRIEKEKDLTKIECKLEQVIKDLELLKTGQSKNAELLDMLTELNEKYRFKPNK